MKVLIAEDDKDSRELLGWLLQKLGYQVVVTENGKDAWEAFRKGRFRLVISDLLMPDIDAWNCAAGSVGINSRNTRTSFF